MLVQLVAQALKRVRSLIFGAASPMAVLVEVEMYWLQYIILHCVSGSRRPLRATCSSVALAGNALCERWAARARQLGMTVFPDVFNRLQFWSPWVGRICIRRSGSLHIGHYEAVQLQLRLQGGRSVFDENTEDHRYYVHGLSSQVIMYKVSNGRGLWVPEVQAWRL